MVVVRACHRRRVTVAQQRVSPAAPPPRKTTWRRMMCCDRAPSRALLACVDMGVTTRDCSAECSMRGNTSAWKHLQPPRVDVDPVPGTVQDCAHTMAAPAVATRQVRRANTHACQQGGRVAVRAPSCWNLLSLLKGLPSFSGRANSVASLTSLPDSQLKMLSCHKAVRLSPCFSVPRTTAYRGMPFP